MKVFDSRRMRLKLGLFSILLLPVVSRCGSMDIPPEHGPIMPPIVHESHEYFWQSTSLENRSHLLTLFCKSCAMDGADLPLVAVLRDDLGGADPRLERLTDVWLLADTQDNFWRRALAGLPFFYWRIGKGRNPSLRDKLKPALNLSDTGNQVITGFTRDLVQWTVLDPMTTTVRASTRAYRANALDQERVHLEEAIGYLANAPADDGPAQLTRSEVTLVIAKLEARKRLFGGLMTDRQATRSGESEVLRDATIRARNWDLLRQCAEKTGLVFEPLNLGGANEYALLWYPDGAAGPAGGVDLKPIWKILNIHDPRTDSRTQSWKGPVRERQVNQEGRLLPEGATGVRPVRLVPIGVYSLDYPREPLLLVDLMGSAHVRRHEMAQRSINEVTAGVIGLSHFANWYYYAAADTYDFVAVRRGAAMDQSERLDCYSRFRTELALDHELDPALHAKIENHLGDLAFNPLESSPQRELEAARIRFQILQRQAADGSIAARVNKERRAELSAFGRSTKTLVARELLHDASFGMYTARARNTPDLMSRLATERLIRSDLQYLDTVTAEGPRPEISHSVASIREAVEELTADLSGPVPVSVRTQAQQVLTKLRQSTSNMDLNDECLAALRHLDRKGPGLAAVLRSELQK